MNCQALKHPRTIAEIDQAMRRAVKVSASGTIGVSLARSVQGKVIAMVIHDRHAVPAFTFRRNGQNITAQVLAVLRGEK